MLFIMEALGQYFVYGLIAFMVFSNAVLFNIMTGLLMEHVMKLAEPDPEQAALEWSSSRVDAHDQVTDLCKQMDKNGDDSITWQDFERCMSEPRLAARFAALDLDVDKAAVFFDSLCVLTKKDEVGLQAFVEGCSKLKGSASSIDLHILSMQVLDLQAHVSAALRIIPPKEEM